MTAWLYRQGSGGTTPADLNELDLMAGPDNPGKNYYVSKQYYRYIRPGAQMVDAKSSDSSVLAAAFDNTQMGAFTIVAINTGTAATPLTLAGNNLPSSYKAIRTSASENAVELGTVSAGSITLPPSSITTLVSGNYLESQQPTDAGADTAGSSGCSCNLNGGTSSSDSRAAFTLAGLVALVALRRRRKQSAHVRRDRNLQLGSEFGLGNAQFCEELVAQNLARMGCCSVAWNHVISSSGSRSVEHQEQSRRSTERRFAVGHSLGCSRNPPGCHSASQGDSTAGHGDH
jgi:MYXO-CTERM domain-containing protein